METLKIVKVQECVWMVERIIGIPDKHTGILRIEIKFWTFPTKAVRAVRHVRAIIRAVSSRISYLSF